MLFLTFTEKEKIIPSRKFNNLLLFSDKPGLYLKLYVTL